MGFADLCLLLGISYDSEAAEELAQTVFEYINEHAVIASQLLAVSRGPFPSWPSSAIKSGDVYNSTIPRRNSTVTTVAPTGTLSLLAGVSSGIEPIFSFAYKREVVGQGSFTEMHPMFEKLAREQGWFSQEMIDKIASGSVEPNECDLIPDHIRRHLVTAHDIAPLQHINIQAAFQLHCENAVSKVCMVVVMMMNRR